MAVRVALSLGTAKAACRPLEEWTSCRVVVVGEPEARGAQGLGEGKPFLLGVLHMPTQCPVFLFHSWTSLDIAVWYILWLSLHLQMRVLWGGQSTCSVLHSKQMEEMVFEPTRLTYRRLINIFLNENYWWAFPIILTLTLWDQEKLDAICECLLVWWNRAGRRPGF